MPSGKGHTSPALNAASPQSLGRQQLWCWWWFLQCVSELHVSDEKNSCKVKTLNEMLQEKMERKKQEEKAEVKHKKILMMGIPSGISLKRGS